jgi:hypothetical protein
MFVNTFFENFTRNREQRNRSIISNYVFILFFVDRGDVCQFPFNQQLYIANMFSKALDEGKEIRVIFFDISKAFDRVWHRGLLFKLKKMDTFFAKLYYK